MKRCPQCHFTFAGDQQFCDFDHTELTLVPGPSRNTPAAPGRRSHLLLAIVALSLAEAVLLISYVDSANESGVVTPNSETHQALIPAPQLPPEKSHPALLDPSIKTTKPRSISTQRKLTASDESPSMPASILKWKPNAATASRRDRSITKRTATANAVSTKRAQPRSTQRIKSDKAMYARNHEYTRGGTAKRTDSKVVAILKKTGSILTKPFRF